MLNRYLSLISTGLPRETNSLHVASTFNSSHYTKALIQSGADVNELNDSKDTPLAIACYWNRADTVNLLLEAGAHPEISNCLGTPLINAVAGPYPDASDRYKIVEKLLQYKANIEAEALKFNHRTILGCAIISNDFKLVKLLLKHKANIEHQDSDGNTPLMLCKNLKMLKLLLKYKPDLNKVNKKGQTVLYIYTEKCLREMVSVLLKNNANPDIADHEQRKPEDLGKFAGNTLRDISYDIRLFKTQTNRQKRYLERTERKEMKLKTR